MVACVRDRQLHVVWHARVNIAKAGENDGQALHLRIERDCWRDVIYKKFRVMRRRVAASVVAVIDRVYGNRVGRSRQDRNVNAVDKKGEDVVKAGVREVAVLSRRE